MHLQRAWCYNFAYWSLRKELRLTAKKTFFKRNGGLLLEEQLFSTDNGIKKTELCSSEELAQAIDHYNENRILGRGGQGIVYKGMLVDGRLVAVKKSKRVHETDVEEFINEVVILSQISHRNVVRLLGCFYSKRPLFQHIHDENEEFPLSWEMRVRIATEVAVALSYLHPAAAMPNYHPDIKSTNILLYDKYRAKVSDFGTSRSVAIDHTHLTTRVLGTFGDLDPEYFRSSQFIEKTKVYSFGVAVVDLLTGEKAPNILDSMEENELSDIVDAPVLIEGVEEEIVAIAELARRCLHLNGKRRPRMKEVAIELERIQILKEGSVFKHNIDNKEHHSLDLWVGRGVGFWGQVPVRGVAKYAIHTYPEIIGYPIRTLNSNPTIQVMEIKT
ncbi:hypothetical protein Pfo_023681 [Paulownia fortunei]|nr:hypothetical protein Pfo_023681 [Paulownia fortunei]